MQVKTIKKLLFEIGEAYPTLLGLLMKKVADRPDGPTIGEMWAGRLAAHESIQGYLPDICSEYADGVRPLPDPTDRLWQEIIDEGNMRYEADRRRWVAMEKKQRSPKGATRFVQQQRGGRVSVELGKDLKEGRLNQAEHDKRLEEVLAYARGDKPKPSWYDDYVALLPPIESYGQDLIDMVNRPRLRVMEA